MKAVFTCVYDRMTNPWYGKYYARGLSLHVKVNNQEIMMDYGLHGSILLQNMKRLKIDPNKITKGLLSHGHGDHSWVLSAFLNRRDRSKSFPLYLHESALEVKKSIMSPFLSVKVGSSKLEEFLSSRAELIFNREPQQITSLVSSTGEIPLNERLTPQFISHRIKKFVNERWEIDNVLDDQSFVLKTKEGLVVFSGDCHSGIINVLDRVKEVFNDNVVALIGSYHLREKSKAKLKQVVNLLEERVDGTKFYLNHSISKPVWQILRNVFGEENVHNFKVGDTLNFEC